MTRTLLWLLALLPFFSWAGVDGVWKDSGGDYWVVMHEATGTAYAVQIDATLAKSTLWSGTTAASTMQLTSLTGDKASLTVNSTSTLLSGSVGAKTLNASSLLAHMGSGNDGVYAVTGGGRYLVYLTLKDGSSNPVLLLDLKLGATGLSHQVYLGTFSVASRKLTGRSLTAAGATADLTIDATGSIGGLLRGENLVATPMLYQALPEVASDYLGYSVKSPGYALLSGKNIKVVNLPDEDSFFAIYSPPVVQKGRVMVVVHGTDGTPYEEIKDEVDFAQQYGYIVVGVQWLNKGSGVYATPRSVYRIIGKALDHLKRTTGNDLSRVAYVGFSRGSAISYEIAWRDLQARKLFDLTIAHSGGIGSQLVVAPPVDDPGVFYNALIGGTLGSLPLSGSKFFLYCGQMDEQWGTQMCQNVNNAKSLIEKNGGSVVRLVDDPAGKHAGYRVNTSYHTAGVQAFIDATP